jgi:hypothetical protein
VQSDDLIVSDQRSPTLSRQCTDSVNDVASGLINGLNLAASRQPVLVQLDLELLLIVRSVVGD